ncbi:hypothetical protein CD144_03390 [Staphylococcus equorum subsp. linens]|uniref:hypothetical protein n=1 Tax=Staphylococcus TaxID=1279 RepID=UPI000281EB4A|nr:MULTISPECIES: hypothetical protein [Staphylococcus]ALM56101.1 hypothetical protein SE1039_03180 [Staphylococcus equorum]EJX17130.1 hypothetical protein SOJ_25790 [Staphylococcus sp. OJ82]MDK9844531.1 hypothetical protein [Staphylococcus equorum]PNZ08757.1 hypothetical protein CD144_03390 [Staphylococcus equorum subsp. linens]QQT17120.1 hypothetical protein I6J07_09475 [Staphylococcus equorum]
MKGPDANDTSWVSVIFTIACLAMSEILENSLYNKMLTAVMILILIFIVIRRLKVTLYDIQTQDDNINTFISVKADYWILYVKDMIGYGLMAAIFFDFLFIKNSLAWLILLIIVILFGLLILFENKFEKKTDIIETNDME